MRLLRDKTALVETYLENVVRGNVKLIKKNSENGWHFTKDEDKEFMRDLTKWSSSFHKKEKHDDFDKLTDTLYHRIIEFRIVGLIQGKFTDHDEIIEQLTKDNQQLSEQLQQAYIPPSDSKVGTT